MYLLLAALITLQVTARVLTKDVLFEGSFPAVGSAVDNSEFLPSSSVVATRPSVRLDGYITIPEFDTSFTLLWVDTDPSTAYPQPFDTPDRRRLPSFSHQYVQDGFDLLPVEQGLIVNPAATSTNPWEWILSPSTCWKEHGDAPYVRCVIVFAITEFEQNALLNGLITFLVHPSTLQTSKAWVQITNDYSAYYQFNLFGFADLYFTQSVSPQRNSIIHHHKQWLSHHMPVKSILDLAPEHSGWTLEDNPFNHYPDHSDCSPHDPYVYSLGYYMAVVDGVLYEGISGTRTGPHPYPRYVVHPSYSIAKSNFISMTVGVLSKYGCTYPRSPSNPTPKCILDLKVSNWIPQADLTWSNITLRNLIGMSDTHYNSSVYGVDEGSLRQNIDFFYSYTRQQKLNFSLNGFVFNANVTPGTKFSYHTTSFYLASVMLDAIITHTFDMTLIEFYQQNVCDVLKLSDMYCNPRTTRGVPEAFGGYGMYMYSDDMAKLANVWIEGDPIIDHQYYLNAMQRGPDNGVPTLRSHDPKSTCYPSSSRMVPVPNQRYGLGFWSDETLGEDYDDTGVVCENNKLVYGSGYGGIRMVIAYQKWAYWQVTSNYDYKIFRASSTLSAIAGCPAI